MVRQHKSPPRREKGKSHLAKKSETAMFEPTNVKSRQIEKGKRPTLEENLENRQISQELKRQKPAIKCMNGRNGVCFRGEGLLLLPDKRSNNNNGRAGGDETHYKINGGPRRAGERTRTFDEPYRLVVIFAQGKAGGTQCRLKVRKKKLGRVQGA